VEPFAGGAMVGLTAAYEGLVDHVFLGELDDDVASVWQTILQGEFADIEWLCGRIMTFNVTLEDVRAVLDDIPQDTRSQAFRTIVKNRMQRGGILAAGAGLLKAGESGQGLKSRWYPETLCRRIQDLWEIRNRITFQKSDAFEVLDQYAQDSRAFFFVDPPYTVGGKKAGARLYTHNQVDHERLFQRMSSVNGSVLLTYDDTPEVRILSLKYGFQVGSISMRSTHHEKMQELLITKERTL